MATHSSILACRIPWTEEPGGLQPSLGAQTVKSPPAMPETWVQSLGWKDLLEKGKAAHSSILASGTPWTEEPGRLPVRGISKNRPLLTDFRFTHRVSATVK